MTELHFFIQVFEREGCKVNIEQDLNGFIIYVKTPYHETFKYEFNNKGEFCNMFFTAF